MKVMQVLILFKSVILLNSAFPIFQLDVEMRWKRQSQFEEGVVTGGEDCHHTHEKKQKQKQTPQTQECEINACVFLRS